MHITTVIGTARDNSVSHTIGTYLHEQFSKSTAETSLVAVADHVSEARTIPPWGVGGADTNPTKWKQIVVRTDTLVFVLPEYNHGYPGEWKLLMDSLYKEYAGKRAYVVAVGGGQFAGARVMEHVLPVLVNFQCMIASERLHVTASDFELSETQEIKNPAVADRFKKFITNVITV